MQLDNSSFVSICKAGFIVAVMTTGAVVALQDSDTSDPFTDYQDTDVSNATEDPFSDYVDSDNDADEVEEADHQSETTSVALKPQQQSAPYNSNNSTREQTTNRSLGQNGLRRSSSTGTTPQQLQPSTASRPVPALPPARQPNETQQSWVPPTQHSPTQHSSTQHSSRQIQPATQPGDRQARNVPSLNSEPMRALPENRQARPLGSMNPGSMNPHAISKSLNSPQERNSQMNAPRNRLAQDVIIDPNLQPTTYNQPVVNPPVVARTPAPRKIAPNILLAENLLKELATAERESASSGQPMGLLDIMSNSDMSRRKQLVEQYWKTYSAWAQYRFAIDELRWIQQIGQVRSEADRTVLEAAESAASDSITARSLELSKQQHLLNEFMGGPRSEILPLPSDMPLVTRYRTNFKTYASKRTMPEKLRMIDVWLPEQQQLIGDRAATVQSCRNAVMQATRAVSQGQSVQAMLQSIELCRSCHSNFVKTIVEYNQQIAEYAMTVRPNKRLPEQVVAMLIPSVPSSMSTPAYGGNQTRQATLQGTPYQPSRGSGLQGRTLPGSGSMNSFGDGQLPPRRSSAATQPPALTPRSSQPTVPSALAPRSNNPMTTDPFSSQDQSGTGGYRPPPAPPSSAGGGFRR